MAFKPGKDSWVMIDGVNAAGTNISPYVDNCSWPQTVTTVETSTFGTTAKTSITSLTDGDTITISGPYDVAVYSILTNVKAAQAAGSATSTFQFGPGGSVSGQARGTAECWVTSVGITSTVAGRVDFSASLQVTGAVLNSTF